MAWYDMKKKQEDDVYEMIQTRDHSGNYTSLRFPRMESSKQPLSSTSDIRDDGRFLALMIADVPAGKATRSTPRALTVWDMRDSSRYATFWQQEDNDELVAARFVPKQDLLLGVIRTTEESKPETDRLVFWDLQEKKKVHAFDLPRTNSIAFSEDGRQLAVAYQEQQGRSPSVVFVYLFDQQ